MNGDITKKEEKVVLGNERSDQKKTRKKQTQKDRYIY